MKEYGIRTTATPEQIDRAFKAAFFDRPSFMSKFKLGEMQRNTMRHQFVWELVDLDDQGEQAARAVQLVGSGMQDVMFANNVGSNNGSRIAMIIEEDDGHKRLVHLWHPRYKTHLAGMINSFASTFKAYAKIIFGNVRAYDPAAELIEVRMS